MFQQSQETRTCIGTVGVEINNFTWTAALFSLKIMVTNLECHVIKKCRGVSSVTGLLDSDSTWVTLSFPE
jgi:hypothetical protein